VTSRDHVAIRPIDRDLVATIALMLFGLVVAVSFARVFAGWSFASDVAVLVVVPHLVSFGLRRASVSGWVATPATALVAVWLVAWQQYASSFRWLLPSRETWELFQIEASLVREQFPTTTAPVVYGAGWAALAGLAVVIVVLLADVFAFRSEARGEALVPGAVLFVFIGALADERLRVLFSVLLIAAGYLAVVALRALHDRRRRVELVAASARSTVVPAALGAALVVAVIAGAVGPRLPGADAEPLYETKGRSGGVTEVVNPLVDIRSRLVSLSAEEVFRIEATSDSYWRATSLPQFDGVTFGLPTRPLERVDGAFSTARTDAQLIRQDIEITGLTGELLPAAADPIEASGRDLRWNPDTSTLVVVGDPLGAGDRFTVVSASPRLQPSQLRAATSTSPPDALFLDLPADFPSSVADTARTVTAGSESSYDAALALQTWFRQEFDYSLDVQAGHGNSAIEVFLRQRVGYCEQFAASYAAMARTLGMPSRVAVGYTAGLRQPDGWFSVRGQNAHAWPEIWFDGLGWVPFEPTPGRGAPGTEQYTGVAPDQDATPPDDDATPDDASATPTTVAPPVSPGDIDGPTAIPDFADPSAGQGAPAATTSSDSSGNAWRTVIIVGLLTLILAAPALVRRVRRRLRATLATDQYVINAWRRATRAARDSGVRATTAMTPQEWARATAKTLPMAARPMHALADIVDAVLFAAPGTIDLESTGPLGTTVARDCGSWAHQVEAMAVDLLPLRQRVMRYFTAFD
jgi:transglutaminase-like putative cysteine protease